VRNLRLALVIAFLLSGAAEIAMTYVNVTRRGLDSELNLAIRTIIANHGLHFLCLWAAISIILVATALLLAPEVVRVMAGKRAAFFVSIAAVIYSLASTLLHLACTIQTIPARVILELPQGLDVVLSGYFFP